MLLGAYGFAIATIAGWPLWAAVLVAIAAASVFALILGIPTLKLRGDYLAIVTIAAAEIVRMVGRSTALTELTGASSGLRGNQYKDTFHGRVAVPRRHLGHRTLRVLDQRVNSWWIRIVGWASSALACWLVWLLIRSPWGRVLKGIREDEDAVRSLGKNVYSLQDAVARARRRHRVPRGDHLRAAPSGPARRHGPLDDVLHLDDPAARRRRDRLRPGARLDPLLGGPRASCSCTLRDVVPTSSCAASRSEQFGWIIVGVALMLLIIFRPQGILGDKKELAINAH